MEFITMTARTNDVMPAKIQSRSRTKPTSASTTRIMGVRMSTSTPNIIHPSAEKLKKGASRRTMRYEAHAGVAPRLGGQGLVGEAREVGHLLGTIQPEVHDTPDGGDDGRHEHADAQDAGNSVLHPVLWASLRSFLAIHCISY